MIRATTITILASATLLATFGCNDRNDDVSTDATPTYDTAGYQAAPAGMDGLRWYYDKARTQHTRMVRRPNYEARNRAYRGMYDKAEEVLDQLPRYRAQIRDLLPEQRADARQALNLLTDALTQLRTALARHDHPDVRLHYARAIDAWDRLNRHLH